MIKILSIFKKIHNYDIYLQNTYLRYTPFHPCFWSHFKLFTAIKSISHYAKGDLLDIGCGNKPYAKILSKYIISYTGLEINQEVKYFGNRADVYGNAKSLKFKDNSFDTILCTEVIEHIDDPFKVLNEIYRVLKPNGILILTAPFSFPVHDKKDYWRFSTQGLKEIFHKSGFHDEKIVPVNNTSMTIAILLNIYLFDLGFYWNKWLYPFGLIFRPFILISIFIINVFFWLLGILIKSEHLPSNILALGIKLKIKNNL